MKPGPETSTRSRCGGRSASSATTILAATSRGGMPTDFVRRMATFVVKSPWPAWVGGVSSTPPSGSGNPAASSARSERGEDLVTDHAEIAGCQTWDSVRRIAES